MYLPRYDTVSIFHCRDLVNGFRKRIRGADVVHLSVPFYEDLGIQQFFEYAKERQEVMECLPAVDKEVLRLPR